MMEILLQLEFAQLVTLPVRRLLFLLIKQCLVMRSALRMALAFVKASVPRRPLAGGASRSGSHSPKAGRGRLRQDRGFWGTDGAWR